MASSVIVAPVGSLAVPGWTRFANGLIIQWGTITLSATNGTDFSGSATFATTFNTVFIVQANSPTVEISVDSRLIGAIRFPTITTTGVSCTARNNVNNSGVGSFVAQYLAIGI